jgi:hypothetical protein
MRLCAVLQGRSFQRSAREGTVIIMVADQPPALGRLAADIGLAGVALTNVFNNLRVKRIQKLQLITKGFQAQCQKNVWPPLSWCINRRPGSRLELPLKLVQPAPMAKPPDMVERRLWEMTKKCGPSQTRNRTASLCLTGGPNRGS